MTAAPVACVRIIYIQLSRLDVLRVVDALLAGEISRKAASGWAGPLHVEEMADPVVEEALDLLTLTDAVQTDGALEPVGYLFDFAELEGIRGTLAKDADA